MHQRTPYALESGQPNHATRLRVESSGPPNAVAADSDGMDQSMPSWHVRSRSSQALLNVEQETHQRQLWNSAPVGLAIVDKLGTILGTNAAARGLLRPFRSSTEVRTLSEFLVPEDIDRLSQFLQSIFNGELDTSIEVRFSAANEQGFDRIARLAAVSVASLSAAVSFTDITELRRLEVEKRIVEERLEQLQRLELVHMMSAGIAHDFKNIVHVIESYAAVLIGQSMATNPNKAIAQEIMVAASRGAMLANRWLAYSRYGQLQKQTVEVNQFLLSCMETIQHAIPKNIEVETRIADAIACALDPCLIEQVLCNLCLNARDAMPSGGVLSVSVEPVAFDSQASSHDLLPAGRYIKFSVIDTGTGIPAEHLDKIFEPFFTTKETSAGTGLGLALVRSIISEHEGAIEVCSNVGQGSHFAFYLPA